MLEDKYNLGSIKDLKYEEETKAKTVDKNEKDRLIMNSDLEKMERDIHNIDVYSERNNKLVINFSRILSIIIILLTCFVLGIVLYGIIASVKYTGGLIGNVINMKN